MVIRISHIPTEPAIYLSLPADLTVYKDDYIIFKTNDGEESGTIDSVLADHTTTPGYQFLRIAHANDLQKINNNLSLQAQTMKDSHAFIKKCMLSMYLVAVHHSFNGHKLYLMFTAEDRVDFRELVKELANHFKKQIRLKQIGPRDRSSVIGGVGKCGRELCCSSWLDKLDSVTMDMVRVQGMAMRGASKVSGLCGKLLCCMAYEVDLYVELSKELPPLGSHIKYQKKTGVIISHDVLNKKVKFKITNPSAEVRYDIMTVDASDVQITKT